MLSSLHFVFRVEETPAGVKPGAVYRISDVDLASRLSFFLWGTIPDRELIDVARRGGAARSPRCSSTQVRRMLADPRSDALGTRFASQWLRLQDLHKVEPDALSFPYFDESLADAMARETRAALRPPGARGSPGAGAADRRLHVRQRAARAALRHRRRERAGVPQGRVSRRHAPRPARPRQHPDADVARQPHVAGAARQVGDGGAARQPAAAAAAERAGSREDQRAPTTAGCCRWPSSWRSIAPARSAARATT